MEVVDDVPVINLRNGITVSEVPLDVVAEGLVRLLDDVAQIPSGFGAQAGCLVVLDEGAAEGLPAVDGAGRERLQPVESLAAHHDREVGGRDVVVAVRRSNGDGVGAQPCLGVRLTIVLLDADWLEGGGPLDGPKPVGEGRDTVKVFAGFVVVRWPSGRVVASVAVALVVGVGDVVFLIVPTMSLALGGVAFAMTIVDAWAQILLVELEAEVILVDLLSIVAGSCRVMTRLGAVRQVVLVHLLGLRGGHMQTSPSLDDLGGFLEALEHLEHRGQIGQRCDEDVLAVVVEDKVGIEVAWSDR